MEKIPETNRINCRSLRRLGEDTGGAAHVCMLRERTGLLEAGGTDSCEHRNAAADLSQYRLETDSPFLRR